METTYRVQSYNLRINGRHVRQATRVTCPDGRVIDFMERMSKRQAIANAQYQQGLRPDVGVA